eukprot:scaffold1071_cov166-Amphora_coffeaeformis.AAC.9
MNIPESVGERRTVAATRGSCSLSSLQSIEVEDKQDQDAISPTGPLEETLQRKRRHSLSLRSFHSNNSSTLLSMASLISYENDDDDSESTITDQQSISSHPFENEDDLGHVVLEWEQLSDNLDPEQCRTVQDSWKLLKTINAHNEGNKKQSEEDYRDFLGEQVILRMMHVDPSCRFSMGISSFRSPRYGKLCHLLVDSVESLVQGLGKNGKPPVSLTCERIHALGRSLHKEGMEPLLVMETLMYGLQGSFPKIEWTEQVEQAWEATILNILQLMGQIDEW